jgi:hypothetical protein
MQSRHLLWNELTLAPSIMLTTQGQSWEDYRTLLFTFRSLCSSKPFKTVNAFQALELFSCGHIAATVTITTISNAHKLTRLTSKTRADGDRLGTKLNATYRIACVWILSQRPQTSPAYVWYWAIRKIYRRPCWEASCQCVACIVLHKLWGCDCYVCNLEVVFKWCQLLAMDEFDSYLKRCRLCACEHRLGIHIFGSEGTVLDLKSKIKMYLSINVSW